MSGETVSGVPAGDREQRLVLQPSRRPWNSQRVDAGIATSWLLAGLLYSLRFHGAARAIVAITAVLLGIGTVGLMYFSRRRVKLTVIGDRLIFSGLLRDRVVLEGHAGRIVDVEVIWGKPSGRRSRLRLFINQAGRTAVSLNKEIWDAAELEDLRARLGLPIETVARPQCPAELRKAYPGTIPWWAAHPSIATVLAIVVIVVLVLVSE
jgi:hypothetical protein